MKVQFETEDEFFTELAADASTIDRNIVRVTYLFRDTAVANVFWVDVVAGYINAGQLVELRHHVGLYFELMGNDAANENVMMQARATKDRIESRIAQLDLNCRAGHFKEA